MSATAGNGTNDSDDIPPPQRPPSPPPHTTFTTRGLHVPNFSAFSPRDIRFVVRNAMNHVAWSCDGRKLAAVGIDKTARVWQPDKSLDIRSSSNYSSGGHIDDIDYVAWNPTHPELFTTSSQKDKRVVFWDARQSRSIQQLSVRYPPAQLIYAPDGKTIAYIATSHHLLFLTYGKEANETKEQWRSPPIKTAPPASCAVFNHTGTALVLSHHIEHSLRLIAYPIDSKLDATENPAAHVGGCIAVALDPRGRYVSSGGFDSIINLFDTSEWTCVRTITACDNPINALSFSHDGEFLAAASTGTYIDIFATETGEPLHRVPAAAPSPTVAWHPSKYIVAYCGQTPPRETSSAQQAVVSLFGPSL